MPTILVPQFDPAEFADRVMRTIGSEPPPTPTGTFVAAVRARSVRHAVSSLWVAWHLATVRGWTIAPRVRARSFALVLSVMCILAMSASLVAAAAQQVVAPVMHQLSGTDERGQVENGQSGIDELDPDEPEPADAHGPDEGAGPDHDAVAPPDTEAHEGPNDDQGKDEVDDGDQPGSGQAGENEQGSNGAHHGDDADDAGGASDEDRDGDDDGGGDANGDGSGEAGG